MSVKISWVVASSVLSQVFECFSYYGLRSVLILFLTTFVGLGDVSAFGKYVSMIAIADILSSLGGHIGDRYLNHRSSCSIGVLLIFIGIAILTLFVGNIKDQRVIYLCMAFVSCGACLFRPNNMTIICDGLRADAQRFSDYKITKEKEQISVESGTTIAYAVADIGFLLAYFFSGIVMEKVGWSEVFCILSLGAFAGFILVSSSKDLFLGIQKLKLKLTAIFIFLAFLVAGVFLMINNHWMVLYFSFICGSISMFFFFKIFVTLKVRDEKRRMLGLLSYMIMFMLFVAFERQNSLTVVLFFKRNVNRNFLGFEIPVVTLMSIMPVTIMIFGPIVSFFIKRFKVKSLFPGVRFIIGFGLVCLSFLLLYICCTYGCKYGQVSLAVPVFAMIFSSIADAVIVPSLFSMCNRLAPKDKKGFISGLAMLIISFGHIVSNKIANSMAIVGAEKNEGVDLLYSLGVYRAGFKNVSTLCFICFCLCIALKFLFDKICYMELSD